MKLQKLISNHLHFFLFLVYSINLLMMNSTHLRFVFNFKLSQRQKKEKKWRNDSEMMRVYIQIILDNLMIFNFFFQYLNQHPNKSNSSRKKMLKVEMVDDHFQLLYPAIQDYLDHRLKSDM